MPSPQIGVVTRVAEAHSDRVDGIDGVARAKAELIAALPADGVAILNADDRRVRAMSTVTSATSLLFGEATDADVRVRDVVLDELARPSFVGRHALGERRRAPVDQRPAHGVQRRGGAGMRRRRRWRRVGRRGSAVERRLDSDAHAGRVGRRSGAIILNDSYNANPTSMRAGDRRVGRSAGESAASPSSG